MVNWRSVWGRKGEARGARGESSRIATAGDAGRLPREELYKIGT